MQTIQTTVNRIIKHPILRLLLLVIGIGTCVWTIRAAAGFGISRILVRYSQVTGNLVVAQKAANLAPDDAQAHRTTAAIFSLLSSPPDAARELETAIALRRSDYSLWLALGRVRDQLGDTSGALAAFDEGVKRAPYYSQPRWQRGNLLLRMGQYEAGFADLNLASQSNPELIPNLIDLAWSLSKGDRKLTEELAQIKSEKMHLAFARFLTQHEKADEAIAEYRAAGTIPAEMRRELIQQLLATAAYKEAFEIWRDTQPGVDSEAPIFDGGFEAPLSLQEIGFGWKVATNLQTATFSIDPSQPHSGSKSLRIDFAGNADGSLVSQLILVEPSKRYQANFAARSDEIVTGGLPLVVVTDAAGDSKLLAQSGPLTKGSSDWRVFSFQFTTAPTTRAVVLSVQREACSSNPCPIFGSISLDSFSLEQLK
jgi:tetratricopeptide (TPR) repeat protein